MKKSFIILFLLLLIILPVNASRSIHDLNVGWIVQVGGTVYRTALPTSAMGIWRDNGAFQPGLFSGTNYRDFDKSAFARPWLFRKRFKLAVMNPEQRAVLKIEGLNYSANILINGKRIASREVAKGAFGSYTFDVTQWVSEDNELTIQLFKDSNPVPHTSMIPEPADGHLGMFGNVSLEVVDNVQIQHTKVLPTIVASLAEANVTIETQLVNLSKRPVKGALVGKFQNDVSIYMPVSLKAGEKKTIRITPNNIAKLHIKAPALWWCNGMGQASMCALSLEYDIEDKVCDEAKLSFPLRELKGDLKSGFTLNGQKVALRMVDWMDDLIADNFNMNIARQIETAKALNINAFRLTKKAAFSKQLKEECDKNGILLIMDPTATPDYSSPVFPVMESVQKFIPSDKFWPMNNDCYNYHYDASAQPKSLQSFIDKTASVFGASPTVGDFYKKAALLNNMEARRAFESLRLGKKTSASYLLSQPWPSFIPAMVDYYGIPTSAYYAARTANKLQQLIYDAGDHTVYAVNASKEKYEAKAYMSLYDIKSKCIRLDSLNIRLEPNGKTKVFSLSNSNEMMFLSLRLATKTNSTLAENTYCLASADGYKALSALAPASLEITMKKSFKMVNLTLKNTSDKVAFFTEMVLKDKKGMAVSDAVWEENYITLLPGETKTVSGSYKSDNAQSVTVRGWNTAEQTVSL